MLFLLVKLLFVLLIISAILWLLVISAFKSIAWILSRIAGVSVGFRVGGWNCFRDIVIKLRKGPVESVSVNAIGLSLCQSLVKLGVGFPSRCPKLQLFIRDLEVVLRPATKSVKTVKTQKARSRTSSGKGKFIALAKIGRFFSLSVTDLVVKTPKPTVVVKELRLDISKDGGSTSTLLVNLKILPILIRMGEPRANCDQSLNFNSQECTNAGKESSVATENSSPHFRCDEFSLSCEFRSDRDEGVIVQNLDISFGDIVANLNEELLSKKKSPSDVSSQGDGGSVVNSSVSKSPQPKQSALVGITKHLSVFPEKCGFLLPKLDLRFMHREYGLVVENNITGIQLKSIKSRVTEDSGEGTRLDVQLEFNEIHLLREAGISVMEVSKFNVVSFLSIPIQPTSPIRAEIDVKLGGMRCNMMVGRLKPWLQLQNSKKKKMVLRDEAPAPVKSQSTESRPIEWTCTLSAPEMSIVVYSIGGLPLYHACLQSSHAFANNTSSKRMAVHMELGTFNLHMADEYEEYLKESPFSVEANSRALVHIAKFTLDLGERDVGLSEKDGSRCKLVLSANVTCMGVFMNFKRVESLIVTAISFQALLKPHSASDKKATTSRGVRSSKPSGKGAQHVKVNLEQCSVKFCGETGLENKVVADPKRVNYGSQGGQVVVNVLDDGTPRTANVMSSVSDEFKNLTYSIALDIFHFNLSMNKEKQSIEVELERASSVYQEYLKENKLEAKVTLFDLQNAKFVRRSGGLKGISICSLFSATSIAVGWEPDLHLSLIELVLRLKYLVYNQKLQVSGKENIEDASRSKDAEEKKETTLESGNVDKHKKKESIFAVDVEILTISAVVGDGVEAAVQVQSIFSENARIGVLLEGLLLSFNGCRLLKSSRMQISRIPSPSGNSSDAKMPAAATWDWVVQGLNVYICLPYRLELRAIDDSVEDMLRALKLITAAKTELIFPVKKENSKPKRPSTTKFGRIKFCIRKLTADIEEEPMQGWLDEHYPLMKKEACELAVRLKFLDDFISKANQSPKDSETNDPNQESKFTYDINGVQMNIQDPLAVQTIQEEIYKQSFRSYYQACQKLVPAEGSGACVDGFQSGFKSTADRIALLTVSATDLEVSLTKVDGGDAGMIEVVKKLDPVSRENNVPFARLYGSNIFLRTGTLVVQLRNYTFPLLAATSGKCEGCLVLAQQATCFQPQMSQDVFVGRWRKVCLLRSATGTTPPMKSYFNLPLHFQKGEVSFGVSYEPPFADVSYAFTVALRRANLSVRDPGPLVQPPKKEKSLPWWDDMRNYIHGNIALFFSETRFHILATTDPYEKLEQLQVVTGSMEIQQSDGRVYMSAEHFRIFLSSLESLGESCGLKLPNDESIPFLETPNFTVEVTMDWGCDSGTPLDHYLFALPIEGKPREKVFDPFRSTSLSLRWNISLSPSLPPCDSQSSSSVGDVTVCNPNKQSGSVSTVSTTINVAAHDLAWLVKFCNIQYLPPHKLRTFSRWTRFGVPKFVRSGNLALDKVITEFYFRMVFSTPTRIKYMPPDDDDPAKGLTFSMAKLKFELCFSRGKQIFTFDCKRELLDIVYQGLDLHIPKIILDREDPITVAKIVQKTRKNFQASTVDRVPSEKRNTISTEKHRDDGFLLSCDYFTVRKQSPKADSSSLSAWQEAGRKGLEMTHVRSEHENAGENEETRSDQSDDEGYNVVVADNCLRVFVYSLKLLWNIENRDAVWSWVGGLSKAVAPPKPSPSRQYAQRKLLDENKSNTEAVVVQNEITEVPSAAQTGSPPSENLETSGSSSPPPQLTKIDDTLTAAIVTTGTIADSGEEGTRHFMVNVIEPQFNLHSEEANGRFLLAALSGRVLAQSFHSILQVGNEMIEQALGNGDAHLPEHVPEMTWKRMEFSVMLEHVQAHVAPTDVDPGAGLQWLPKIRKSSPKVKRTGPLLERVFMPCDMYLRYTRHKGGTPDLKVKPLKELTFNSHNIMASMTSRQFQVMMDVLTNLLFARPPKPRKSSRSYLAEDDEDVEEEADEVVPDGVEEVELAKVNLEQKERQQKLLFDDVKRLSLHSDQSGDANPKMGTDLWMVSGGRSILVQGLKNEIVDAKKCRKEAYASLRVELQKAAQQRLMEKEKNKSPSYAMRISVQINKIAWSMILDGKPFAEAEINYLIFEFDRDYRDMGVALLTSKVFVVRNCLSNAKSDTVLAPWNPPPDWGKKVMLRVDAKQGLPRDGNSRIELFQVEIYPLKIYLTETMYRMMWGYFFPEEEQDSQRRQEVWKVSTTAAARRVKKGALSNEAPASCGQTTKESEATSKLIGSSGAELRRTSSFDRSWEETVADSVAAELVLQAHSSGLSSSKSEPFSSMEQQEDPSKSKLKETKPVKTVRTSQEEKKLGKSNEDKRARPRKVIEFNNIKISQVELLLTFESSRFNLHELKLLMDTFHRVEFTGSWRRLFARVKKHVVWGTLKSVTGMQGKKFKDKGTTQQEPKAPGGPDSALEIVDIDGDQLGTSDQYPNWLKRPNEGAGDGFVTSIKGLFTNQRRKAKAFVLRTMRGEENDFQGEWSESEAEFSPFARQLTITKAKKLIRRHTKKFCTKGQKGSSSQLPCSPREIIGFDESDSSKNYKRSSDFFQYTPLSSQPDGKGKHKLVTLCWLEMSMFYRIKSTFSCIHPTTSPLQWLQLKPCLSVNPSGFK